MSRTYCHCNKYESTIHHHFKKFILFLYLFWLRWVFVAARQLSLVAASGARAFHWQWCSGFCCGAWAFHWQWLLLLKSTGSRRAGFSSCGTWAQ